MKSYLNKNGSVIIRKCGNCVNYKLIDEGGTNGYCKILQLYFAFTLEKSVYGIVKDFYLCDNHKLPNEDILKLESEEVDLLPHLLERNAKKKS
jgi:hypothetical protein